tara:strand:+ start:302 stop:601 length:300 start_codon:yes stop_codon:yes gene_type:complete
MWYTDAVNEITQYFVDVEYNNTKENKARVKFRTAIDISKMPKETKDLLAQAVTMVQDLAFKQDKIEKANKIKTVQKVVDAEFGEKKVMEGTNDKPSDTE